MKTAILYKGCYHDFKDTWFWSERKRGDLEPYFVEIPDDFSIRKTVTGEMFFKKGNGKGYELYIGRNSPDGEPYLIGGCPIETIKLNVIGPVNK